MSGNWDWNARDRTISRKLYERKMIRTDWTNSFMSQATKPKAGDDLERELIKRHTSLYYALEKLHEELYHEYLANSPEWEARRNAVMFRDGYKCRICGEDANHVHHLTYERKFNESIYDLIAVCERCHTMIHNLD